MSVGRKRPVAGLFIGSGQTTTALLALAGALLTSAALGLVPAGASLADSISPSVPCQFQLGFLTLEQLIPDAVGSCIDSEHHGPNGDGLQDTVGGLLVWRKSDNWTAFTDGYRTWVNGPFGMQERLNTERFAWESDDTPAPDSASPLSALGVPTPATPVPTAVISPDAGAASPVPAGAVTAVPDVTSTPPPPAATETPSSNPPGSSASPSTRTGGTSPAPRRADSGSSGGPAATSTPTPKTVPSPSPTNAPIASTEACPPPVLPGRSRCFSLIRTDAPARAAGQAMNAVGPHRPTAPSPAVTLASPALGNSGGYDPSYLESAYNLASASNTSGSGLTVAVVDAYDDPNAEGDLAYYRGFWGLPACTSASGCFRKINQAGAQGSYPAANSGWAVEESLDVDMVSAICQKCSILLLEANSDADADLYAAVNEAADFVPAAVSNSYGTPEYNGQTTDDINFKHPGIAITVSSGDTGYGVNYPASSPYVTAVGGTTLNQASNTGTRNATESAWAGAGSGCSAYEPKPGWQADSGCTRRTVADVSAVANPSTGVWVYDTYSVPAGYNNGWNIIGGTSTASPIVASVYALAGKPVPGSFPSAAPYGQLAALFDITSGANGTCSPAYLCTSGAGYDGPTGLGTPNGVTAFSTVSACSPRPPVSISPVPNGQGGLLVTVAASGANNLLQALQFGTAANGLIDIPGGPTGAVGGFSVPLGTSNVFTFTVRRQATGSTTVPFTVVDNCGSWPTFVGGGAGAF